MTNFEKHKDEISKIATESNSSPAKKDGVVVACGDLDCGKCDFNNGGSCRKNQFKWLYEDDGEEPDGCDGCKYEYKREDESPCTECCNNYTSKWERKPKKTRQDEFLKHYPDARQVNSVIKICPKDIDENYDRCTYSCIKCHKDYWLQEMKDGEGCL